MSEKSEESDSRPSESANKRQRISKACSLCRKKRIRCDGNVPCGNCKLYKCKDQCIYEEQRKKRSTNKKEQYIQELEYRIRTLEGRLNDPNLDSMSHRTADSADDDPSGIQVQVTSRIIFLPREVDYYLLNDGSDEEAESEFRIPKVPRLDSESTIDVSVDNVAGTDVLPEESASQVLEDTSVADSTSDTSKGSRARPITEWLWAYFTVTELPDKQFINKRSKKLEVDKEIRCQQAGCTWKTFNSVRGTSTSNMKLHLQKHGITNGVSVSSPGQRSISAIWKHRAELSHQARLERNLLRWTVTELQPFTVIERPTFRAIFADLPGVTLPFGSRRTLQRRTESEFVQYRLKLREELAATCNTIALSLDVWTSKNSIAVLAVIGHWLNQDFEYQERLLEFKEIEGAHTGENLAEMVENLLIELDLEYKLLTITADNASNNETLVSELYFNLSTRLATGSIMSDNHTLRFHGLDSYI
ncbi:hypothetical protein V1524DRAFT_466634, partial [Lipomyces starkeyi]